MSAAAILGSAFHGGHAAAPRLGDQALVAEPVDTPFGPWTLHRLPSGALVSFRHGLPHRLLPHQIPYRAQAWALREAGATHLLVTSSVGVLRREIPLFAPLVASDLLFPDNRLPDGSACSMWPAPHADHGHLLVRDGLFSRELSDRLAALAGGDVPRVVFAYAGGPRGKTPAENRYWAALGADVNAMTLAPEVVLANELELPVAGLCVGHKYSVPGVDVPGEAGITASLDRSRAATVALVLAFLADDAPVAFANRVYRLGDE